MRRCCAGLAGSLCRPSAGARAGHQRMLEDAWNGIDASGAGPAFWLGALAPAGSGAGAHALPRPYNGGGDAAAGGRGGSEGRHSSAGPRCRFRASAEGRLVLDGVQGLSDGV